VTSEDSVFKQAADLVAFEKRSRTVDELLFPYRIGEELPFITRHNLERQPPTSCEGAHFYV